MMSCVLRNSGLSSIKFLCATLSHMSIGAGIVISISFQKIDDAPRTQTGAQRNNQICRVSIAEVKKLILGNYLLIK